MANRRIIPSEELHNYGFSSSEKWLKTKEDAGEFPKRVQLSPRKHGYVLDEILAHGEKLIQERDAALLPRESEAA